MIERGDTMARRRYPNCERGLRNPGLHRSRRHHGGAGRRRAGLQKGWPRHCGADGPDRGSVRVPARYASRLAELILSLAAEMELDS